MEAPLKNYAILSMPPLLEGKRHLAERKRRGTTCPKVTSLLQSTFFEKEKAVKAIVLSCSGRSYSTGKGTTHQVQQKEVCNLSPLAFHQGRAPATFNLSTGAFHRLP